MVKHYLLLTIFWIFLSVPLQSVASDDPTRPQNIGASKVTPDTQATKTRQVKQPLTGIFFKANRYFAVLEGQQYKVGDTYRNSRVIRITADEVTLRSENGTYQLTLFERIKK